ncbi:hypothetical protein BpHYR1_041743 [Brachionus plicatilis]|uniref:DUF6314 domain-containing protein n=1 Tax=Brachionus plicatilis TaxID=10195 RepID=A0A3M7SFY5_BRAPC|nr:hypothetical protein BpHYR1_041743 [Brachionus plicatilis]
MVITSAKYVFSLFQGTWLLKRTIVGHGVMKGKARFEKFGWNQPFTKKLLYREDGVFELNDGNKLDTYKEYLYMLENEKLAVYFFENNKQDRLFHFLDFKHIDNDLLLATAIHHCSLDIYNVKYEILSRNKFQIVYKVNGPEKNYVSQTLLTRINKFSIS